MPCFARVFCVFLDQAGEVCSMIADLDPHGEMNKNGFSYIFLQAETCREA